MVLARKDILEYEGFRARIDMAKPQPAVCHLIECRVSNHVGDHERSEPFRNAYLLV
jgi:hypothetical protein